MFKISNYAKNKKECYLILYYFPTSIGIGLTIWYKSHTFNPTSKPRPPLKDKTYQNKLKKKEKEKKKANTKNI